MLGNRVYVISGRGVVLAIRAAEYRLVERGRRGHFGFWTSLWATLRRRLAA